MASVAERLAGALTRVLRGSPRAAETWFVLVVDEYARGVLGPVLGARGLLVRGVALVAGIEDRRQPIPTACAVYVCLPTARNLGLLRAHAAAGLYGAYELVACAGPTQLHQLALAAFRADPRAGRRLARVVECPLSLRMVCDDVFVAPARPDGDPAVDALFAYAALLGPGGDALGRTVRVPHIYTCGRGARALALRLFEALQAHNVRAERLAGHVLLLADREADPVPLLAHPQTYAGLADGLGLFADGDSARPGEPPLGLGPAFQDGVFRAIAAEPLPAATAELGRRLRGLSARWAAGGPGRVLGADALQAEKARCERHAAVCERVLAHAAAHGTRAFLDAEQEQPGQRRAVLALPRAPGEDLARAALCALFATQDALDALAGGLFGRVQDLLDALQAATGAAPAALQERLRGYAARVRDAGTARPGEGLVGAALSLARRGLDAVRGRPASLAALLLSLVVPGAPAQPRYPGYFSLDAHGDAFQGAAHTAGLFVVGEGSLEEAARLQREVREAFRASQMDPPRVTYGCTSLSFRRSALLAELAG